MRSWMCLFAALRLGHRQPTFGLITCRLLKTSRCSSRGCGAATAYVLGGLGQQVALNANVGQDAWGDMLRAWLQSVEVDVAGLKAARTAVHVIALDAAGRRQSHYYRGEKVDWRASLELRVPQVFLQRDMVQ